MYFAQLLRHKPFSARFMKGLWFVITFHFVVFAMDIGVLWIELFLPRQRCKGCSFTFTFDYGLGLVRSSTESFRYEIMKRCHGRSIADVAREYELSYTTVERWFYTYAEEQVFE